MSKISNGSRIVHTGWGGGCGVVVKLAKSTALVRLDGREKDERIPLNFLRPETPTDVAKRARDEARRAWLDRRPNVKHVNLQSPSYGNSEPNSVTIYGGLRSPSEMRQAADELRLIADWFEQRPTHE